MTGLPSDDEDSVHQLFAALRERVVAVTSDVQARIDSELDDAERGVKSSAASLVDVLFGSVIQVSNLLAGALRGADKPDDPE